MAREARRIDDDPQDDTGPGPGDSVVAQDGTALRVEAAGQESATALVPRPSGSDGPDSAGGSAPGPPPLPDPAETAQALALCVAEILTGARDVESIARWITDDVQRHLHQRAAYAARARSAPPRTGTDGRRSASGTSW